MRPVKGVLPIALRARAEGKTGVLVPPENAAEAAVVAGLQVIPIHNLREAAGFLEGETNITPDHGGPRRASSTSTWTMRTWTSPRSKARKT